MFRKTLAISFPRRKAMLKLESQSQDAYKTHQQLSTLDRKGAKNYQQLLNPQGSLYQEINRILITHQSGIHQLSTGQKISAAKVTLLGGGKNVKELRSEIDRIQAEIKELEAKEEEWIGKLENAKTERTKELYSKKLDEVSGAIKELKTSKKDLQHQIDDILKREGKEEATEPVDAPQSQGSGSAKAGIFDCTAGGHIVAIASSPGAIINVGEHIKKVSLEQFVEALKKFYQQQDAIPLLIGGSLSIEDHYVALAVITSKERKEKEKQLKQPDLRPTIYETIFQPKERILLENLFEREELKNAPQKRVLIQGSAGIGKSTLCQNITYQWVQEKPWLSRFKAVIWLKFRDLTKERYPASADYTAYQVIERECGFRPGQIEELLGQQEFREHCLLFLDGYDEIPDEKLEFQVTGKGRCCVLEAFQNGFPHIIVTTRPQSMSSFKKALNLEILGFEDQEIKEYVNNFFRLNEQDSGKEQAKKQKGAQILRKQLRHPLVFSLCHIPINLEIFCSLALEGDTFLADQPLGIAEIYDKLTDWLIRRFFRFRTNMRGEDISAPLPQKHEEVASAIQALEELAWRGLSENRLYFKNTEKDPEITTTFQAHVLGITDVTKIGPFRISNDEGWFIHLTFQEFFAAKYLARLFFDRNLEKAQQIIVERKFHPRFQLVFSMASGLLAQNKNKQFLQSFFDMLYDSPRDLGKSREGVLLARRFEECGDYAIQLNQYEDFIRNTVRLLEDPSITIKTKFDLLNGNHYLLANDEIIRFFLERKCESDSSILLRMLNEYGTQIPGKTTKLFPYLLLDPNIETWPQEAVLKNSPKSLINQESSTKNREVTSNCSTQLSDTSIHKCEDKEEDLVMIALKKESIFTEEIEKAATLLFGLDDCAFAGTKIAHALIIIARAGSPFAIKAIEALKALLSDANIHKYEEKKEAEDLVLITQKRKNLTDKAMKELANLILDPHAYDFAIYIAIEALVKIIEKKDSFSKEALEMLESLFLNSNASNDVRFLVAKTLVLIAQKGTKFSEIIINELESFLLNAKNYNFTNEKQVDVLITITREGEGFAEKMTKVLKSLLLNSNASNVSRFLAAEILGEIAQKTGSSSKKARKALESLLSDLNVGIIPRLEAAKILLTIANKTEMIYVKSIEELKTFIFNLINKRTIGVETEGEEDVIIKRPEYFQRLISIFLNSFIIQKEDDMHLLIEICKAFGIAFYEMNGQYKATDEKESYLFNKIMA